MEVAFIPRIILRRFEIEPARYIHVNVLISHALVVSVAIVFARFPGGLEMVPHVCLIQYLFNEPCPGCGITRSVLALLQGDFVRAWAFNPIGPLLFLAMVIQVPLRALVLSDPGWSDAAVAAGRWIAGGVMMGLVVHWMLVIG